MYILCISICVSICISILIISHIRFKSKQKRLYSQLKSEYLGKILVEINNETFQQRENLEKLLLELSKTKSNIESSKQELASLYENIAIVTQQNQELKETLYNSIEKEAKQYKEQVRYLMILQIESEEEKRRKTMEDDLNNFKICCDEQKQKLILDKERIIEEIENYKKIQDTINESILREREIKEQQNFFKINLSEDSVNDIELLQSIRKNLKKTEILDKIIYENYISKPVLEMIKRVLKNESPSGIYKITSIDTGETYIGKSTDVRARWQQHCKTAFNCGTIASSLLHSKMKEKGIQNFTFELVERVEKDQLTQREKFWINFYKSKEFGLNERNG